MISRHKQIDLDEALLGMTWVTARIRTEMGNKPRRGGNIQSAPTAPAISLTVTPDTVVGPANIALSANATDADGSLPRVDFYADTTLLASVANPPYIATWANAPVAAMS